MSGRRTSIALATGLVLATMLGSAIAQAPAPTGATAPPRVVVLDPGHGGTNAGTRGHGVNEKQLTLELATQIATRLRAQHIRVVLTRTSDRTMTLRQRVAIADGLPADLFISLHANASPTRAQRGFETFVLSARAIETDGRALRAGTTSRRPGLDPEIMHVLDDVERGSSQWEAADLAARIQRGLRARRGAPGDRGVRQDAHHVLLGATMPAVLVEVGFLDHPVEGKELLTPTVQAELADAIAEAIADQLADL